MHPFLVLSPQAFNAKASLVMGLPMTTAEYNADNPFAVAVGQAKGSASKTSFVLCHQPKSFVWRVGEAAPNAMGKLSDTSVAEICAIIEQITQLTGLRDPFGQ